MAQGHRPRGDHNSAVLAFQSRTLSSVQVAVKIVKKDYVKAHKQKIAREIAVMRLLEQ